MAQASSATVTQQTLERGLLVSLLVKSIARMATVTLVLALFSTAEGQGSLITLHGWDGRGRPFDLVELRGNVVALTFVSRFTHAEAMRVHGALAGHGDVKVVSVVDFQGIPSFVRGYARRKIAEADGRVLHLCDEKSQLRQVFGARPDKQVDIFIIDREGGLRGHFNGAQLGDALRLVDAVRSANASN
jgi:hypothetical protein